MLGVIGGMGPLATADFMRKLAIAKEAARDQDHVPALVWSVPQIPDRSGALIHGGPSPLPALVACATALRKAGAGIGVMPCNTAHHWAAEVSRQSGLGLLHIAEAALALLRSVAVPGQGVGVLATEGTHRSGFYDRYLETAGFHPLSPSAADQAAVQQAVHAVKRGQLAEAGTIVEAQVARLRERGAGAIVLACTELPLVAPQGDDLVDATFALARACVRWHEHHAAAPRGDSADSPHNDNDSLHPPTTSSWRTLFP